MGFFLSLGLSPFLSLSKSLSGAGTRIGFPSVSGASSLYLDLFYVTHSRRAENIILFLVLSITCTQQVKYCYRSVLVKILLAIIQNNPQISVASSNSIIPFALSCSTSHWQGNRLHAVSSWVQPSSYIPEPSSSHWLADRRRQ